MTLNVAISTYNVHGCVGTDRRHDPERTLEVLRELDADVIALQELQWNPHDALHLLGEFARDLDSEAVAGPTMIRGEGHYGNVLLSRLPVRRVSRIDLGHPGREPRGALDVTVDAGGVGLRVLATHLGLRPDERRSQVQRLLGCLADPKFEPAALLGDLNEWYLWGRPLRWLRRYFGRSPAPATFPSRRPFLALDRIWVRPGHALAGLRVHATPLSRVASDHLPLRADLTLGAGARDSGTA